MLILTLIAAFLNLLLLSGVLGVYFTYSNSVVPGLDNLDPEKAVEAMRKMNVAIMNPPFLLSFTGPVITSAATGFLLLGLDEETPAYLFLAAAVVYLIGSLVITMRINVPMNNALENSTSTDWKQRWAEFSPRWRRWNNVRGFLTAVALILCGIGLYLWGN